MGSRGTADMSHTSNLDGYDIFYKMGIHDVEYPVGVDIEIAITLITALQDLNLLPTFFYGHDKLALKQDVAALSSVFSAMSEPQNMDSLNWSLFWKRIPLTLKLSLGTRVDLANRVDRMDPTFYAAVRNLATAASDLDRNDIGNLISIPYFSSSRVITSSRNVLSYVEKQKIRAKFVDTAHSSQFANSAYYMGSKRALAGFIVEGVSSILPDEGVVVDLMCGSGAASGAFSRVWRTFASDAQQFSRVLAVVQGGGFSAMSAQNLLDRLLPVARDHLADLRNVFSRFLDWEDAIFHGDIGADLLCEYKQYVTAFPNYPGGGLESFWNSDEEVARRKCDVRLRPYCLFTTYFANVYFGLRQCLEIDSLRFAIDNIEDAKEREWAMGALIAAVSSLGTTYGGHFAQPVNVNVGNFSDVLDLHARSIMHEFTVRLINLATESERIKYPVETVGGPWRNALLHLDRILCDMPVAVYLDAPYKREEYSRYYHLLETLVCYSYPSCIGKGKIPSKTKSERFNSEFFTRTKPLFTSSLVNIMAEIVARGWTCAWSYADSGTADIVEVLETLNKTIDRCNIRSYATPYVHKPQGRRRSKPVTEYLITITTQK